MPTSLRMCLHCQREGRSLTGKQEVAHDARQHQRNHKDDHSTHTSEVGEHHEQDKETGAGGCVKPKGPPQRCSLGVP